MKPRRGESDFAEEIESHIRLEADRLIASGMPEHEAEAAARRAFGSVAITRERFYESGRWLWFDQLWQDLRYSVRSLRKSPGFTAAAALTIALGVGANTAVFSLMDAVLLRSLPVADPQSLVFLGTEGSAGSSDAPPYPGFEEMRRHVDSVSAMAVFASDELRVDFGSGPEQMMGQIASGNYFEVLGLRPALGRLFTPADEALAPPVAVISDRLWRQRFSADPATIGKTIRMGSRAFTIAGVTPPGFWGLEPGRMMDVTFPVTIERQRLSNTQEWWLQAIVARRKPGVTNAQVQGQADSVYRAFLDNQKYPADMRREHFDRVVVKSASHGLDGLRRRFSEPLWVLVGIAAIVLAMAVANLTNLLLARGVGRSREFAIRLAAGAGRGRLVRQVLTEVALLFLAGSIPGLAFAALGADGILALLAEGRRGVELDAGIDWRVLGFTAVRAGSAAMAAALIPAWRALQTDPEQALRDGQARSGSSRRGAMITRGLVSAQVALSLILLVGTASFVWTLSNLRNTEIGLRHSGALTLSIGMPEKAEPTSAYWMRGVEAVRAIPGVRSAALSIHTPFSGRDRGRALRVRGFTPRSFNESVVHVNAVSDDFFEALGIALVRGRLIAAGDRDTALINEVAARFYFAGRDPIGETVEFGPPEKPERYRIIGVVADIRPRDVRETPPRFLFLPMAAPGAAERRMTLTVSATAPGGELGLLPSIRRTIAGLDSEALISDVVTIQQQIDSTLVTERLLSGLSSGFGGLSALLAAVGLFGVLSYRVGQQRRAIGIRLALGESPRSIARRVLGESGVVVLAGLAAGLPAAVLATRAIESMLWEVKPGDPLVYAAACLVLLGSALLSSAIPARRAASVDPAEALRHE
jgi:predicted permease